MSVRAAFSHRYGPLVALAAANLAVCFLLRAALFCRAFSELEARLLDFGGVFVVGLLYDLAETSYVLCLPALILLVLPEALFRARFYRFAAWGAASLLLSLLLLDAVAEWLFWTEFGSRFNFIAVDYLIYRKEVLGNIRESFPVRSLLISIAAVSGTLVTLLRRRLESVGREPLPFPRRLFWTSLVGAGAALSFFAVGPRPRQFSANSFANELSGNGLYELFSAYRHNALDYEQFYRKAPPEQALRRLRELLKTPEARFRGDEGIERDIVHEGPEKRLNVALVSVESLSASFLGSFGNPQGLTPELDALAPESLVFTRVYATGTRTVRGLEALTLSVPPSPGQSIVRRPGNEDLFSLGRVFNSKGYESKYLYGGYGYFDNMNYFFSHNGYQVVDRTSLKPAEISGETIWGVADEDLFALSLREMDRSASAGKPFFVHVMTTTNHRPFNYPSGRIDLPSGQSQQGAVKYTDYAIGRFIREARSKPWFENTVFVIVADHCHSSAGRTELPLFRYHIPLIVYSPAHVAPQRVDRLMSQIDLAPTLLGLLNFSYPSKFYGFDLFQLEPGRERAFISTYQSLGYLSAERLVLLDPRRRTQTFAVNLAAATSTPVSNDAALIEDAVSWYQSSSRAFKSGQMR